MLIKTGANNLANASPLSILTNLPLFCGYALYGMSTVLLVMALRNGQLSILYPVISLTYVWVTLLGVMIFKERIDTFKIAGVAVIVVGVAVIGRGGKT